MVTTVTFAFEARAHDRIIEPMIALARGTRDHRILVAGAKSLELMLELQQLGYARTSAAANSGHPAQQYDAVLIDWRQRTLNALEPTLDRLAAFVAANGVMVVWVDAQKAAANQKLRASLEKRGFDIEDETRRACGDGLAARRREAYPFRKAA
jgi:hypothetical protein